MLKECRVIYTFHGLPYDCTCVEPLPTQDQSFLLCSSHLLFHFSAQSPRIFVLNDYGAQYVAERAAQFPKSVFNDRRVIARSATPAILDNVRFCLLGREHVDATTQVLRYAAVKGNGVLYALAATVAAERLERLELAPAGDVGTDVSCAVAMEREDRRLLFAGSAAARSILFSLTDGMASDALGDQNSPHCCQLVGNERNHRDDDSYLYYAHGFARLLEHTAPTNFLTRVYLNLTLNTVSAFQLEKQANAGRFHLVRALHLESSSDYSMKDSMNNSMNGTMNGTMYNSAEPSRKGPQRHSHVVLSDDTHTEVIRFNGQDLTMLHGDESPLLLRVSCIDVVEMNGADWGVDGLVCVQVWNKGLRAVAQRGEVFSVTEEKWDVLRRTTLRLVACVDSFLLLVTAAGEIYRLVPGETPSFVCIQQSVVGENRSCELGPRHQHLRDAIPLRPLHPLAPPAWERAAGGPRRHSLRGCGDGGRGGSAGDDDGPRGLRRVPGRLRAALHAPRLRGDLLLHAAVRREHAPAAERREAARPRHLRPRDAGDARGRQRGAGDGGVGVCGGRGGGL